MKELLMVLSFHPMSLQLTLAQYFKSSLFLRLLSFFQMTEKILSKYCQGIYLWIRVRTTDEEGVVEDNEKTETYLLSFPFSTSTLIEHQLLTSEE